MREEGVACGNCARREHVASDMLYSVYKMYTNQIFHKDIIKEKNAIILLNKIDLETVVNIEEIREINKPIIEMSVKNKTGIDELYKEISKM